MIDLRNLPDDYQTIANLRYCQLFENEDPSEWPGVNEEDKPFAGQT